MKKASGINYMILALLAFASIGLEVLLAFGLEPMIYSSPINEWTDLQTIIHWVVTCSLWGVASWRIVRFAKKKYDFDLFQKGDKMSAWQWAFVAVFMIGSLILSYFDWNGSKVIKEFYANYYFFETALVTLILVFGQNAFEKWFHKQNIPYGGIIVAITWGIGHFFTKDILTGIVTVISGMAFGSVYLLVNRDIRKTYPILWIMFVL